MIERAQLQQCLAFINSQLKPAVNPVLAARAPPRWRAVTISRQAGSGGHLVAERLAELKHRDAKARSDGDGES